MQGGNFFLNSCAPGYQVFLVGMTGSMAPVCSGYCAAGNISNVPAEAANARGVPTATAKLVNQAAPAEGDGLCTAAKKGSGANGSQNCIFLWPFTVNGQNVEIAPEHLDTLGICFSFAQYQGDFDDDPATPPTNFPNCRDLPKTSTDPNVLTAANLGCQTLANSMFEGKPHVPFKKDFRVGFNNQNVKVAPHKIVTY
jgi:hypothetical protein